jgi:hypothetical protein
MGLSHEMALIGFTIGLFVIMLYFSILLHYHKSSLSDITPPYYATAFIRFSSSVYSTTTCFGLFYKAIFRRVLFKLVLVTLVR